MLLILVLFLPAAACFFWMLFHSLTAFRSPLYPFFMGLYLACGVFCVADSCFVHPGAPYQLLIPLNLTAIISAPCIPPLVWSYIQKLRNYDWKFRARHIVWIIVPVAFFTAGSLLILLSNSADVTTFLSQLDSENFSIAIAPFKKGPVYYYAIMSMVLYQIIMICEYIVLCAYFIRFYRQDKYSLKHLRDFFRGKKIRVSELQMYNSFIPLLSLLIKVIIPKRLDNTHPWISAMLAVMMLVCFSFFAYIALFSSKSTVTFAEMLNGFRYNYRPENKGAVIEQMMGEMVEEAEEEALKRIQERIGENLHIEQFRSGEDSEDAPTVASNIFNAVANSWDEDSLLSRFQSLMMNEQLFLNPRLSLVDVAEKLNTNKTYISKLVNNTYNLGFPELINTLRIDYAEQYILKNRHARQNEIAEHCGFLSASSFNNIFKKVTGMTPKVWIASMEKNHRK